MRLIPKGELVISFMSGMMDGVIRHPAFCDTFTVQIENIGMPYICRFMIRGVVYFPYQERGLNN